MNRLILLILIVFLTSGCQTIFNSEKSGIGPTADISLGKESKTHVIEVEIGEDLRGSLIKLNFHNLTSTGKQYVLVSGSLKKPIGVSIERKKISVSFINEEGKIIAEGVDRIVVSHLRRPHGSKGKFSIKLPYDEEIKKCVINFKK